MPLNGIAKCLIELTEFLPLDVYKDCAATGGFILIDRLSNITVGAGMITELFDHQINNIQNQEGEGKEAKISLFEVELNALIRKHFPDWNARDISKLFRQ